MGGCCGGGPVSGPIKAENYLQSITGLESDGLQNGSLILDLTKVIILSSLTIEIRRKIRKFFKKFLR